MTKMFVIRRRSLRHHNKNVDYEKKHQKHAKTKNSVEEFEKKVSKPFKP